MIASTRSWLSAAAMAFSLVGTTACDDSDGVTGMDTDTVTVTVTDTVRVGNETLVFDQIERLGNPLVSEAPLDKRLHGFFNTTNPSTDVANFRQDVVDFVRNVAGRDQATANTIAGLLLPDMLAVFPNRAPGVTAAEADASAAVGWLTHALAPGVGYGGRTLDNDDAVDKALMAVFGPLLSDQNVSPGLATDNVPDPRQEPNTFPYLAQ